ncbi:MAG TPA: SDR family oxidoreductase, partial [Candidatus Omnitrophota bacterium]|nr:SDR family oxidoreductase [Candidatus Omnitrophota bacterium]
NGLYNTDCCGYKMDISDMKDIKNGMKKAAGKKGRIDILVNNAVYCEMGNPESMTEEEWAYGVDGTLNSAYRCLKAVIPYMGNGSKIVNISSMYGMISPDMRIYREHPDFFSPPNYGAAKAGIIQLTKYFAVYLAAKGIGVNCLTPGSFPSKEVRKSKGFIKELTKKIPIGRVGEPHELGGAVLFLSSGASSYVTGQNIIVDGGWTIW